MSIVRTARGTTLDKSTSLTLTLNTVQVVQYSTLVVALAYDQGEGTPNSVMWGTRELNFKDVKNANGLAVAVYTMYRNDATKTESLVATWNGTAPTAKVMFATQITGVWRRDILVTNANAASVTPTSGALQTTGFAEEFLLGVMASEGPIGDTVGSPSLSYSLGQRVGTTGDADDSNVTVQEIFKITTVAEDTRARMTGVTERDWCVILITLEPVYNVVVDNRVTVLDVAATSQAAAETFVEDDVLSRYPIDWTVEILP